MWAFPHEMGLQRKSSTCQVIIGGKNSDRSVVKCLTRWNWCPVQSRTTPNLAGSSWFLLKSKQALESSPGFLFRVPKPQGFNPLQRKPVLVVYLPFAGCTHPVCVVLSTFAFFPRRGSTETCNSVHPRTAVYFLSPPACHLHHLDAGRR